MAQRRLFRHCTSDAPMPPAPTIPRVVASLRLISKRYMVVEIKLAVSCGITP